MSTDLPKWLAAFLRPLRTSNDNKICPDSKPFDCGSDPVRSVDHRTTCFTFSWNSFYQFLCFCFPLRTECNVFRKSYAVHLSSTTALQQTCFGYGTVLWIPHSAAKRSNCFVGSKVLVVVLSSLTTLVNDLNGTKFNSILVDQNNDSINKCKNVDETEGETKSADCHTLWFSGDNPTGR